MSEVPLRTHASDGAAHTAFRACSVSGEIRVEKRICIQNIPPLLRSSPIHPPALRAPRAWLGRSVCRVEDRVADTGHSNQHIYVRAARPSVCARCGAGAGCSAMKYKSLWRVEGSELEKACGRMARATSFRMARAPSSRIHHAYICKDSVHFLLS